MNHPILSRFIKYNKSIFHYNNINTFRKSSKHANDKNNKIRENIIGAIINNKIPAEFYTDANTDANTTANTNANEWTRLKTSLFNFIHILNNKFDKIECIHKGGRMYHYDFIIKTYNGDTIQEFNIELKFNASTLQNAPQFVSPMKPSQYLNKSFENYYYDSYLKELSDVAKFPLPSKENYIAQIHSNNPRCLKEYQELYYKGCKSSSKYTNDDTAVKFYNFCKDISKKSIASFITQTDLDIEKLSNYLYTTQKNKIYMLYSNNKFNIEYVDINDYKIESVTKNPSKSRYECISINKKKINVLLRWKNGNGIAFPAFQIS
uniref:Uncharacterized protein n=1 Tax=viral metagenome TaxID=1070528 RepID=A0A6C0EI70_9ZZZZ